MSSFSRKIKRLEKKTNRVLAEGNRFPNICYLKAESAKSEVNFLREPYFSLIIHLIKTLKSCCVVAKDFVREQ